MTQYALVLTTSLLTFWASSVASQSYWNIDRRCLRRNRHLRQLSSQHGNGTGRYDFSYEDDTDIEMDETYEDEMWQNFTLDEEMELTRSSNLRGGEEDAALFDSDSDNATVLNHRELQGSRTFALKLYWTRGACWQEEWREREWCMECEGGSCSYGDILEIQPCRNTRTQRFQWLGGNTGRLKVANDNLCLQKTGSNYFRLRQCSSSRSQLLARSSMGSVFELYPRDNRGKCLNQHHHPKPYEEIIATPCSTARKWRTNRWQIIAPGSGGTRVRDDYDDYRGNNDNYYDRRSPSLHTERCRKDRPCGVCGGDCDSNTECAGSLVCYQRNGYQSVPGCAGRGVIGRDYCVAPQYYY